MSYKKFKFKRHVVHYENKKYVILIPQFHEKLWVVDWADDWYNGGFINGNVKCMMSLIASFGVLAFNPYTIAYFPIRNKPIPETLLSGDNRAYDMVFCTNRIQLKLSEWKYIKNKLQKQNDFTNYTFKFDVDRMEKYFEKELKKRELIWDGKWLPKAGANMELRSNTAFFIFPKSYYVENAIDLYKYFNKEITENHFSHCYDSKSDFWTCYTMSSFVYGAVPRYKLRYERPFVTFYLELYDLDIINRYMKKKVKFVENTNQAVQPARGGYNTIKISVNI